MRALIDACERGLFLCVGMAQGLGTDVKDLEAAYPALYAQLLGHAARPPLVLTQIRSVPEAVDYAEAFLKEARDPSMTRAPSVISREEIAEVFNQLAKRPSGSVTQGDFFDRLHEFAQDRAVGKVRTSP